MNILKISLGQLIGMAGGFCSHRDGTARLLILCYHRVLAEPDPMLPDTLIRTVFEGHMQTVRRYFRPIPLCKAVQGLVNGTLPRRAVCITFDDGYADNLRVALPVLKRYEIPATIFISTGFLDGGRMWNDTVTECVRRLSGATLRVPGTKLPAMAISTMDNRARAAKEIVLALRRLSPKTRDTIVNNLAELVRETLPDDLMLTSRQTRLLSEQGVEIGAHTVNHPILATLPDAEAKEEILESKLRLEAVTGSAVEGFAYPNGQPGTDYGQQHVNVVAQAGFSYAVSTARGTTADASNRYELPRLDPWDVNRTKFGLRLAVEYRRSPSALA